jgi:hypothetical protein
MIASQGKEMSSLTNGTPDWQIHFRIKDGSELDFDHIINMLGNPIGG